MCQKIYRVKSINEYNAKQKLKSGYVCRLWWGDFNRADSSIFHMLRKGKEKRI